MKVTVKAAAKLNLSLDVVGRRSDGYHLLEMVMQSVDLFDTVTLTDREKGVSLSVNRDDVPQNEANIGYKAARLFCESARVPFDGFHIKLKKRIPMAAGLAGGSADAAAVLLGLNEWFGRPLSLDELRNAAVKIGADVPFCLMGGTVFAEGIGSLLTPLPSLPRCFFVLAKKGEKPSTAQMYAQYDQMIRPKRPRTRELIDALCSGQLDAAARLCRNVFDEMWESENASLRRVMQEHGALGTAVSGSGPTLFGVFEDEGSADRCAGELKALADEVFVCEPTEFGCEMDA